MLQQIAVQSTGRHDAPFGRIISTPSQSVCVPTPLWWALSGEAENKILRSFDCPDRGEYKLTIYASRRGLQNDGILLNFETIQSMGA